MITYNTATLTARLNDVITKIDAGAGNGQMRVLSPINNTIALITLNKPSATVAGNLLTFSGLPLTASTILSTNASAADIEDSTGQVVASGLTVGNSTAFDIFMASTAILAGQALSLTFATITGR
jgi:hypothetical protein